MTYVVQIRFFFIEKIVSFNWMWLNWIILKITCWENVNQWKHVNIIDMCQILMSLTPYVVKSKPVTGLCSVEYKIDSWGEVCLCLCVRLCVCMVVVGLCIVYKLLDKMMRRKGGVPYEHTGARPSLPFCLFLHVHSWACASVSHPERVLSTRASVPERRRTWTCVAVRVKGGSRRFCGRGLFWKEDGGWWGRAKLLYREMDRTDWRCAAVIGRPVDAALAQLRRWDVGCCWLTEPGKTTAPDCPQRDGERKRGAGELTDLNQKL